MINHINYKIVERIQTATMSQLSREVGVCEIYSKQLKCHISSNKRLAPK